ncbi:MAG: O-antigen ligase family protein [Bacteroidota bacterium]
MAYALLFFYLFNAKIFFGATPLLKFLPNVILFLGVIRYTALNKARIYFKLPTLSSHIYLWVAFLLIWGISILRTAREGATMIGHINDLASIFLFSLVIYLFISSRYRFARYYNPAFFDFVLTRYTLKLLRIPTVAVTILFFIYAIGFNHPSTVIMRNGEPMVILKALGISLAKKAVPFTGGTHPTLFAIWAGATFAMNVMALATVWLKRGKRRKMYFNVLAILGFLIFADSRGTMLITLLTVTVLYVCFKFRLAGILRWFVLVVPLLPFIFTISMGFLAQTSYADILARGNQGPENLSTLSARTVIWNECLEEIQDPTPIHFVGWGEHGQGPAGVARRYAHIFPPDHYDDVSLIVTHNFFFQAFFEVGYLGVSIILLVLFVGMNHAIKLYHRGFRVSLVYIGFLVYFVLSGALESTFGNHFKAYTLLFVMMTTALYTFRSEYSRMLAKGVPENHDSGD